MKKPIEVGQRVAVYRNGNLICRGNVVQTPGDGVVDFEVKDANGILHYSYLENLRILKPKPKRVCHCNREPDRWALFTKGGVYTLSLESKKEASDAVREPFGVYENAIAPIWAGPKEKVK